MSDPQTHHIRRTRMDIASWMASHGPVNVVDGDADNIVDIRQAQIAEYVRDARLRGANWAEIGEALGMSARAVFTRYGEACKRPPTRS